MNKQWFLVRDSKQEIDAVLTMVPWSLQCTLTFNKATRNTLKELFSLLQVCTHAQCTNGGKLLTLYMHMSCTPKFVKLRNFIYYISFSSDIHVKIIIYCIS